MCSSHLMERASSEQRRKVSQRSHFVDYLKTAYYANSFTNWAYRYFWIDTKLIDFYMQNCVEFAKDWGRGTWINASVSVLNRNRNWFQSYTVVLCFWVYAKRSLSCCGNLFGFTFVDIWNLSVFIFIIYFM